MIPPFPWRPRPAPAGVGVFTLAVVIRTHTPIRTRTASANGEDWGAREAAQRETGPRYGDVVIEEVTAARIRRLEKDLNRALLVVRAITEELKQLRGLRT